MSEEQNVQNTQTAEQSEDKSASTAPEQVTEQVATDSEPQSKKSAKKADKKQSARDARKEESRLKKEWEDSIVASKKVKREESRRKVKRVMLVLLVFSLIVTSIVYVMLLFIQENSVRITASSTHKEKSISLSADNEYWTPYLNVKGPTHMWDLSYNKIYEREQIDTVDEVRTLLSQEDVQMGTMNGEKFIRFTFMLKNTGSEPAYVEYNMTLDFDEHKLHDAVRVMWGQSFKNEALQDGGQDRDDVTIYASLSQNQRLQGTNINIWRSGDTYNGEPIPEEWVGTPRTQEQGFLEYVAYPVGSDKASFDMLAYESEVMSDPTDYSRAQDDGYFATTPFASDDYIFQRNATLGVGDIMYCYVCIWIEGSDFDCIDAKLGGYCKIGLNFIAS